MASKKEHVSGLHFECKSHEQQGVYAQCSSHLAANYAWVLLDVRYSGQWDSPVSNWSPEVSTAEVVSELLASQLLYKLTGVSRHFSMSQNIGLGEGFIWTDKGLFRMGGTSDKTVN